MRPLLDVQRIDSAIDRLTQRRADLPEQRELDELNGQRVEIAGLHAEKQAELDTVIREQNKLEHEIGQITDKMKHEQERLYSGTVQNAKELSNIQAELDSLRRRKVYLEDQELDVMERREVLEAEAAVFTDQLTELDGKIGDVTARRDVASVEIENEVAALAAEREQLVPTIDPEIIELYEDVRVKRGGVAVAALDKGVCKGCNLPLSPLARDEIRRSDEAIVRCENCRRLLVVV